MNRIQKGLLVLGLLLYVIGLATMIWPLPYQVINRWLSNEHINWIVNDDNMRIFYIIIFCLTVMYILIVIFWPSLNHDVTILKNKNGHLTIVNKGLGNDIKTFLARKGITTTRIKIKNTRRYKKFYIQAVTRFDSQIIPGTPVIQEELVTHLTNLLGESVNQGKIFVQIKIDRQVTSREKRQARVI